MAFGVTIDINARTASLTQQVNRATQDLNRFAASANSIFKGLGAGLGVGIFTDIIKSSIDAADNLNDLSKSTGLAIEQLAGLKLASQQSGTDLDSVADAINKLSVNIGKDGEKFKQLGIDAKDPLEAFAQLADVFIAIDDPQQRAAVGAAALGKGWAETAPLLSEGGDAIRAMVKEGSQASGITAQMAKDADDLNDKIAVLSVQFQGFVNKGVAPLIPQLSALIGYIKDIGGESRDASQGISVLGIAFNGIAKLVAAFADIVHRAGLGIGALAAKATALATLDFSGFTAIDKAFSEDIKAASDRYDAFAKKLDNPVIAKVKLDDETKKLAPSQAALNAFVGIQTPRVAPVRIPRVRVARTPRIAAPRTARTDEGAQVISNLQRELALLGESSRVSAAKYDTQRGALAKISESQKTLIVALNEEIEAYQRQDAQWKQLVEDANAFFDLKQEIAELSIDPNINLDSFNRGLARIQDQLKGGLINEDQAKQQFDVLGNGFNENFIDQAVEGTDRLSQFAEQAARNIQDSFANFLFDPFSKGVDGMLVEFLNFIRQAAAESASAELLDAFKPLAKKGKDAAGKFLSELFSFADGGIMTSHGPLPLHAYASGGIVNSPQLALFGEGRQNEAFVPLPDGRSIPVSLKNADNSSGSSQRPIVINNTFVVGNDTSRQSQQQIAASAGRGIQQALLRTR